MRDTPPLSLPQGVTAQGDAISIRNPALINETVRLCYATGEEWRAPIFRAARDGLLNVVVAHGGVAIPRRTWAFQTPTLVIIADDRPDARGPAGWPSSSICKALRWAGGVIVHGSGAEPHHGDLVVRMALEERQGLLVECESRHLPGWLSLVTTERRRRPRLNALAIAPRTGSHPVAGAPAGVTVQ